MQKLFLQWLDDRTGIPTFFRTLRSRTVPESGSFFRLLPVMILFAFLLQILTGIMLWTFYVPGSQSAWESLFYIQFILPGGWMVRGIHHYSAQLLTVLLGVYLLGLIFSGRYRSPREFVFWTVFGLFLCSLASSLTGDLLSWTLSGFSATLIRVRFLQMLPGIGEPLFRIVAGGPEFGTLTIPRFLVLHIFVFGGGFFVLAALWRFFDHRSDAVPVGGETARRSKKDNGVPFWSNEAMRCSLVCLLVMATVLLLVYRKPLLHAMRPDWFPVNVQLPKEASLGVRLGAPADPSDFHDAARPEWTFRALYHFSNLKKSDGGDVFPGEKKYIPIFVVPGGLLLYVLLIPVIGRLKVGHFFNLAAVSLLVVALCYLTYASYRHDYYDPDMASFREDKAQAEALAHRAVELCLAPEGIPPTGALTLLRRDPLLQGPVLYERHCAVCHPFSPLPGESEHPDFKPIPCETVKAPNLYDPVRREWIEGFFSAKRIQSDDYFGKTKFAGGTMVGYVRVQMKEILREDAENEDLLDELITLLYEEAKRDGPRIETREGVEGLTTEQLLPFPTFDCGQCHMTYARTANPVIQAPDLRGYMSRDWMIGIVADPESPRFYGPPVGHDKGNDAMPVFHRSANDATMSMQEIETLVDWLRGKWYRFEKHEPFVAPPLPPVEPPVETEAAEAGP